MARYWPADISSAPCWTRWVGCPAGGHETPALTSGDPLTATAFSRHRPRAGTTHPIPGRPAVPPVQRPHAVTPADAETHTLPPFGAVRGRGLAVVAAVHNGIICAASTRRQKRRCGGSCGWVRLRW